MAINQTLAIFFPTDNEPPSTNYATLDTRNGHPVLNFDTTTQETAIFSGIMPSNYGGGGISIFVHFMAASATTGTIAWGGTFEKCYTTSHDLDSDDWATEQLAAANTVPGTSGQTDVSEISCAAGSAGTDSIGALQPYRVRIRRDVANDSAAGDAQLIAIELRENS